MGLTISSSSAEIMAKPERLIEAMRAGNVINLADLNYTIAPTAELVEIAGTLTEQEEMVAAWPGDTGIAHAIKILPCAGARHGPRIKVAVDPPDRFRTGEGGKEASVPFDRTSIGKPVPDIVPDELLGQVRAYIELNRDTLLAFYDDQISGVQLAAQLRQI